MAKYVVERDNWDLTDLVNSGSVRSGPVRGGSKFVVSLHFVVPLRAFSKGPVTSLVELPKCNLFTANIAISLIVIVLIQLVARKLGLYA